MNEWMHFYICVMQLATGRKSINAAQFIQHQRRKNMQQSLYGGGAKLSV